MRLTVVGCAAAWSRVPGRASSSYLVELGAPGDHSASAAASPLGDLAAAGRPSAPGRPSGPAILLDMGQGSFSALSGYRDPTTIDGVLISHAHPDHCIDLVPLRLFLRYGCEPARTVTLRGPAELRQRFDGLTNEPDFLCDLPGDPLSPGTFELAGFEVAVAPVLHKDSSFAFRVAPAGRSGAGSRAAPVAADAPGLVYSGDCGRADDLLALIRPGDTLLVEASHGAGPIIEGPNHLNVAEVVRVATAGRVGRVVLTHFLDDVDPQEALELARSTFAGETLVAEPGLRLAI
jgi:ribonuclease BN (tRNA processing enzyme)